MLWIVCAALVFCLCVAIITSLLYWYETLNSPQREYLTAKRGYRLSPALVLASFWQNLYGLLLTLITYPLGLFWPGNAGHAGPRIVLLHGLYHCSGAWVLFRLRLWRAGYRNVYAYNYFSFLTDYDKILNRLKIRLRELPESGGREVVLIGHSLGGLLVKGLLEDPEISGKLGAAISLAAPHQGSKVAALALGRLGRSLAYNGELSQRLSRGARPLDLPRLSVYSLFDNIVLPGSALRLDEPGWQELEFGLLSHMGLLFDRKVFEAVLNFLKDAK